MRDSNFRSRTKPTNNGTRWEWFRDLNPTQINNEPNATHIQCNPNDSPSIQCNSIKISKARHLPIRTRGLCGDAEGGVTDEGAEPRRTPTRPRGRQRNTTGRRPPVQPQEASYAPPHTRPSKSGISQFGRHAPCARVRRDVRPIYHVRENHDLSTTGCTANLPCARESRPVYDEMYVQPTTCTRITTCLQIWARRPPKSEKNHARTPKSRRFHATPLEDSDHPLP